MQVAARRVVIVWLSQRRSPDCALFFVIAQGPHEKVFAAPTGDQGKVSSTTTIYYRRNLSEVGQWSFRMHAP